MMDDVRVDVVAVTFIAIGTVSEDEGVYFNTILPAKRNAPGSARR